MYVFAFLIHAYPCCYIIFQDLIIFPDDAEFIPVRQCTTGRAFLLKLKPTNRKYFFWMQVKYLLMMHERRCLRFEIILKEPKTDKDEEIIKKVNDLLNHPPAPGSSRGNRAGAGAGSGAGPLGGMMGIPEDELTPEQMSEIQNVLGGLGMGGGRNLDQAQLMQLMQMMGAGGDSKAFLLFTVYFSVLLHEKSTDAYRLLLD